MCTEEEERITVNSTSLTSPHIAKNLEESHISKCVFPILVSLFCLCIKVEDYLIYNII